MINNVGLGGSQARLTLGACTNGPVTLRGYAHCTIGSGYAAPQVILYVW